MSKEQVEKLRAFFLIAAWFFGTVGSIGYDLHCDAWFITICLLCTTVFSWDYVTNLWKTLIK